MNMAMRRIRDARLCQQDVGYTRVEAILVVAGDAAAEQLSSVGNDDRRGIDRTDYDASGCSARIDQDGANRMREFAGLATTLSVAPVRRCRHRRDMNGLDDLAIAQRRFERAGDEVFHHTRANEC